MEIKTADGNKNVAGGGTTALGIIGTALGGLAVLGGNQGLLGGVFGGGQPQNNCNALMAELAREKSERYADAIGYTAFKESVKLTDALSARVTEMDKRLSIDEATVNAQIACIQNTLSGITKTVVPNTSVCPGWGSVTITPATTTTVS